MNRRTEAAFINTQLQLDVKRTAQNTDGFNDPACRRVTFLSSCYRPNGHTSGVTSEPITQVSSASTPPTCK